MTLERGYQCKVRPGREMLEIEEGGEALSFRRK